MNARPGSRRQLPVHATVLAVVAVALLAACGAGAGTLGPVATPAPTPGDSIAAPSPEATPGSASASTASPGSPGESPAASPERVTTLRAYFFLGSFTGSSGLVPVLRGLPATTAVGSAAITALLDGPSPDELAARPAMYTAMSADVRFLGLTIDAGIATIDFSRELWTGDARTVEQRIAQVVYTLTQFPTVSGVRFESDGQPVSGVYGTTYTRSNFQPLLPPIWVDRPAWGGVLGNPGRVTGLADVFEAQFRIQVLDAAGTSLVNLPVSASCGTGCLGTFDVTLSYTIGTAQWGTLRVYDLSAKDGSKVDVVDYPVWLTPS